MNGPIAQLVALTCCANAFLRGVSTVPRFFPDNSTCKFCDSVSFIELNKPLIGAQREVIVANTPDEWFGYLKQRDALGVRLMRQLQNNTDMPDRMSAGFVGGGSRWELAVRYSDVTEYWMSRWKVWNREAPEQRIWRVLYVQVARKHDAIPAGTDRRTVESSLSSALSEIRKFSERHNCGYFADCFTRALKSLDEKSADRGYHKDLCPSGTLSASSRAIMDAAQTAWVFGGMGSWNDMSYDGAEQKEYERVSEQLYAALTDAICAAVNETEAG